MRLAPSAPSARPPAAEWKPRLTLDEPTLLAARAIVARQGIKGSATAARRKIEALLRDKFGERRIELKLPDDARRRIHGEMSFVLWVDGAPDQGLIFAEAKADGTFYGMGAVANDHDR